ncbi:hypothetical protein [uncultured Duncaniella sp.]|uniref:hypothetical protein n=1 Tax=uncultured Duncaniella sp. TaxID=2768039 RepID=UPI0026055119|nr:hypothetical protein [uncultured Duncaniella sp.]
MNVKFYTLLYIDIEEKRQWQGTVWTGEDRLKIFLRNAAVLNKSLTEFGGFEPLTILTNKPKHIQLLSEEIGYKNYNIKEIEFNLNVPKGIKFYSAHFKIDAFKFLSSCPEDEYSILMDNDIVLLRELPKAFHRIIDNGIPMVYHYHPYDITVLCRILKNSISAHP